MEDLGAPSSYLTLEEGAPVYACDGEGIGKVAHVLADADSDIFDGLVLDTSVLPGNNRFVDGSQVEEIFERGVLLKIDSKAADALPKPSESAAAMEVTPEDVSDTDEDKLKLKLRRAWDVISGKG